MKFSCYQHFKDKLETYQPASYRALILRNMLNSSDEVIRGYALNIVEERKLFDNNKGKLRIKDFSEVTIDENEDWQDKE